MFKRFMREPDTYIAQAAVLIFVYLALTIIFDLLG